MAAAAAGAGIVLAVAAAGGTYASLNSQATARGAAVLRAGSASIAVTSGLVLASSPLYPGSATRGSAVITNTGSIPLRLRVTGLALTGTVDALANVITVGVTSGPAVTAATCAAPFTPSWSGTFVSTPAAGELPVTVAAGSTAVVCVSLTIPTSAPDSAKGRSAAFTLTIDGRQL